MRLTLHTDYAFRTLIYLGVNSDRLIPLAEVARVYGISVNHLVKVIHGLGQEGFIQTIRGRSGGIRLARPPEEISLLDVISHTEGDLVLLGCMREGTSKASNKEFECLLECGCAMKNVLNKARLAFLKTFSGKTLADVITPHERRLLARRQEELRNAS
ncbi:Rrf2 family transcriptional regulator [Oecophyllibacter saccharovorans]|uniref:Rrf2 family transcriptional regulator n=1 Tax=Oecophyllibacter saccharovorans TaxID=2558360 RepID=A0A506UQD4_9PROT|nr:Rrf2 family transcriptional regulator [Oecophyllibacter saccharovorans]QDH15759.1 Rrf2 family transcriptional regulator [Oecophyllibacter saccharovorans]TPW35540.1 Rrf2 family transcriptional regulator [Oecophyllibacter saccharovorans]